MHYEITIKKHQCITSVRTWKNQTFKKVREKLKKQKMSRVFDSSRGEIPKTIPIQLGYSISATNGRAINHSSSYSPWHINSLLHHQNLPFKTPNPNQFE